MSKIESGRSFAIVISGVVPPEIPEGQENGALLPGVTVSAVLMPLVRNIIMQTTKETPEAMVKRLSGPLVSLTK